jgi:hypothetical protein
VLELILVLISRAIVNVRNRGSLAAAKYSKTLGVKREQPERSSEVICGRATTKARTPCDRLQWCKCAKVKILSGISYLIVEVCTSQVESLQLQ